MGRNGVQLRNGQAKAGYMNEWDYKSIEFPLTSESIVIELGGYQGRWSKLIADKYHPRIFAFEPQVWAAEKYRKLLGEAAQCFTYGLGKETATLPMGEFETDGCSFTRTTRTKGTGELREYHSALAALNITAIDLMLMNIEGYEFILLPHIMPLVNVKYFMIQFHCDTALDFAEYHKWRADMTRTHNLMWDYGTALSAWERKDYYCEDCNIIKHISELTSGCPQCGQTMIPAHERLNA